MKNIPTCLFYRSKHDLDEFLLGPDSYLFDSIYDLMVDLKAPHYQRLEQEIDPLTILNEACALATKISIEKHPEQTFVADIVNQISLTLNGERWYVLSILYFILAAQSNPSKKYQYIMRAIEQYLDDNKGYFEPTLEAIEVFIKKRDEDGLVVDTKFYPRPEKYFYKPILYTATNYFSKDGIRALLNYCTVTKEDRLFLLQLIQKAYQECDDENNGIDNLPF